MAFFIPAMPLTVNIWRAASSPLLPPDVVSDCNLCWGERVQVAATGGTTTPGVIVYMMSLLVPALTDIRGIKTGYTGDFVECPAGSGRFYEVAFVDDIGKGFMNEHRSAQISQAPTSWPFPTP